MTRVLNGLGFLRTLFFTLPLIYATTIVVGATAEALWLGTRSERHQHQLARLWARLLVALSGVRVYVRGRENLEDGRSYVYVANHLSYADIPILMATLPAGVRFMAKASLFGIPFTGWYMKRSGHMPVVFETGSVQANANQVRQAVKHIRVGRPLVVFPEGGRSRSGRLEEFKPGIFFAALLAEASVVPVTIGGSHGVLAYGSWVVRPGRVEVVFHPPVSTVGLKREELDSLVARVRRHIEENLREAE